MNFKVFITYKMNIPIYKMDIKSIGKNDIHMGRECDIICKQKLIVEYIVTDLMEQG